MARHFLFEGDLSLAHSQTHWAQLADLLKYFWLSYFAPVEVFKCRGCIPTCELNLATLDQVGLNMFQLFLFSTIMQDDHPQWGTVFLAQFERDQVLAVRTMSWTWSASNAVDFFPSEECVGHLAEHRPDNTEGIAVETNTETKSPKIDLNWCLNCWSLLESSRL